MLGRLEHIVQTDREHITIPKYVAALLILSQVSKQIDFWSNIKTLCPNLRAWEERKGGKVEMSVGRLWKKKNKIHSFSLILCSSVLHRCPNQQCMASPAGTDVMLSYICNPASCSAFGGEQRVSQRGGWDDLPGHPAPHSPDVEPYGAL